MKTHEPQGLYIVTGASRGLGQALALQLLTPEHTVLGMARHANAALRERADATGATLTQWQVDLSDAAPVSERLREWLGNFDSQRFASATLINNAGVIPALVPLRDAGAAEITNALRVGLEAVMLLTSAFLDATRGWHGQRRVLNISSGLGRRPMASQAAYCAAKAGMDLLTHCVALEEAAEPNGTRVCSLAPGVIDTDMQVQLRAADADAFPDIGYFRQLHDGGTLASPEQTASRILAALRRPEFGDPPIASVHDMPR